MSGFRRWGVFVLLAGCGILMGVLLRVGIDKINYERAVKFPNRGVPVIEINLNGVSIDEINEGSKEIKYSGNELSLYESDGDYAAEDAVSYQDVEVKGRGNGTWTLGSDKKPYQIKFDEKVELIGLGRARKWNLLANAMDATNLRTEAAFCLEEILGMRYRYEGRFVELYVDGEYRGLYYLTRAVEISKDLVDLRDPMGLLVELDNLYWEQEKHYITGDGDLMVIKDAVSRDVLEVAIMEFLKDYNGLEIAVTNKKYGETAELVDLESFAQYYLLSEFTINPDAYWTSFYFYKDGDNDKIHVGPGWDFDLAFANRAPHLPDDNMVLKAELQPKNSELQIELSTGWRVNNWLISRIMFDMMEMPEFQEEVRRVYLEKMSGRLEELVWQIEMTRNKIRLAVKADEELWGDGQFELEVNKMLQWIVERYEYFETIYGENGDMNKKF